MAWQRIIADRYGDPDVLEVRDIASVPELGAGEALVRIDAAGVGYTDTILRRGKYVDYKGGLPLTPGYDFAGIVERLGAEATAPAVGTRVCDMPMNGAYGEYLVRPANGLVVVPDGVTPEQAVQVPLIFMTAWQMLTRSVRLDPGATILVVGASGSVGRALLKLARHLGLRAIGTASAANLDTVRELGGIGVDYREPKLAATIRTASGGRGVYAAFDAVGGASWQVSWAALAKGGTLVGYGLQDHLDSGGNTLSALRSFGRLLLLWPLVGRFGGTKRMARFYNILGRRGTHPDDYLDDAATLLALMASGAIEADPVEILPLSAAAEAHRRIAGGRLDRRLILRPPSAN